MKTLAERLKIGREKAGMSQAQLAEKIGLSQQSVAKIENGETLQPRKIKEIAKVLDENERYDILLVIGGCTSCCASYEQYDVKGEVYKVWDISQVEDIQNKLTEL